MQSPRSLRQRNRERGSILVTAILVIVVMLLIAVPFLFKLSAGNRSTERAARATTAFNLAEAGVDKVMWYLNPFTYPSGADTEAIQWDFTGVNDVGVINNMKTADNTVMGNVQVVLAPIVGVAPDPQTRTLTATGFVPFVGGHTVDRTVRVTLLQEWKSIFDVGFFVDEYFYVRNGFFLDAYDSRLGAYGAAVSGGGTNSLMTEVYFGTNSYIDSSNPNSPGDASWVIDSGGGSNDVYGTVLAGGDAAEDGDDGTPDPSLIEDVINTPDGVFKGDEDRMLMNQEYQLPPVDVYNLPPKEILGSIPSVGLWFTGYNSADVTGSTGYYADRLNRAPLQSELSTAVTSVYGGINPYNGTNTFSGSGTLTPANSGVYTSFFVGGYGTSGTLNISGGDVVIYVTSYGDSNDVASFYMGKDSSINIADGSSLTLILGNTSMVVEQGFNINAAGSPPQAANCVILGTNQFAFPANANMNKIKKASDADQADYSGLIFFEHGQSDGNIYAALYAPKAHMADLQGQNHINFYGAAIVDSMEFKVQVDFHYDKALADLKLITGGFDYWRIINWTEVVGN